MGMGQASPFIDHGEAYLYFVFLGKLQFLNRPCRTDLTAQGAPVFTIADARNKDG
jgi:hypothetical protein